MRRARFVFLCQDVFPEVVRLLEGFQNRRIEAVLGAISRLTVRRADAIIALGYPDVDDVQRSPDELLRPTTPSRTPSEPRTKVRVTPHRETAASALVVGGEDTMTSRAGPGPAADQSDASSPSSRV